MRLQLLVSNGFSHTEDDTITICSRRADMIRCDDYSAEGGNLKEFKILHYFMQAQVRKQVINF